MIPRPHTSAAGVNLNTLEGHNFDQKIHQIEPGGLCLCLFPIINRIGHISICRCATYRLLTSMSRRVGFQI